MGMPLTKHGAFTYRDYLDWPEHERRQLLDGVAFAMAPPSIARQTVVFEPDLVVVCDPSKLEPRGIRGAPDLVIEVLSPSTASLDLVEKRQRFDAPDIRRAEGELTLTALPDINLNLDFMSALREQPESP